MPHKDPDRELARVVHADGAKARSALSSRFQDDLTRYLQQSSFVPRKGGKPCSAACVVEAFFDSLFSPKSDPVFRRVARGKGELATQIHALLDKFLAQGSYGAAGERRQVARSTEQRSTSPPMQDRRLAVGEPYCEEPVFFRSGSRRIQHIKDHLLTQPEADHWRRVERDCPSLIRDLDDDQLEELRDDLGKRKHRALERALGEWYGDCVEIAMNDAARAGWTWTEVVNRNDEQGRTGVRKGIGASGIFSIWNTYWLMSASLLAYARPGPNLKPRRRLREEDMPEGPPDSKTPCAYHRFLKNLHRAREERLAAVCATVAMIDVRAPDNYALEDEVSLERWQAVLASRPTEPTTMKGPS